MSKLAIFAVLLCMLLSCADDKGEETTTTTTTHTLVPPSQVRLEQICRSYVKHDYTGFVDCMHSCRFKPESYLTQMKYMLKQRFAFLQKDSLVISDFRTGQILLDEKRNVADVYLDIAYSDGREEEILLPMIYDDGKWWVK